MINNTQQKESCYFQVNGNQDQSADLNDIYDYFDTCKSNFKHCKNKDKCFKAYGYLLHTFFGGKKCDQALYNNHQFQDALSNALDNCEGNSKNWRRLSFMYNCINSEDLKKQFDCLINDKELNNKTNSAKLSDFVLNSNRYNRIANSYREFRSFLNKESKPSKKVMNDNDSVSKVDVGQCNGPRNGGRRLRYRKQYSSRHQE